MKQIFLFATLFTGCSTVTITQLIPRDPLPTDCEVQIFTERPTQDISELCLISAIPSAGFDKSAASAIQNAKPEVCKCGTNKAFIKSTREQDLFSSGAVTLVGFK